MTMKTGSAAVTGKGKKRLNGFLRFVRTVIILALILGITGGIAVAAVNIAVIGTAKKTILTPDEAEKLEGVDCIIVLGCQVKKDVPSDMLYDRIVTGVDLYRRGVSEVLFMSGDSRMKHYDEVGVMKRVACEKGVPEDAVDCDGYALSTYDSIYRAAKLYGCKKAVIVTQEYHLYRAVYIAKKMGLEAYGVSASIRRYRGQKFQNAREAAARVKDFAFSLIVPDAEMGLEVWKPAETASRAAVSGGKLTFFRLPSHKTRLCD